MVKYKDLNETEQKVLKFHYLTELLTHLSYQKEQDIPLMTSQRAYDRGSTSWSKERLGDDTLYLFLYTKGSNVSKSFLLKTQDNEVFVEYKAKKRGLDFDDDSLIFKIADIVEDEYEGVGLETNEEVVPLAYELIGTTLFEDLIDQVPKLAKDLKISKEEMMKRMDMFTMIFIQLGKFKD